MKDMRFTRRHGLKTAYRSGARHWFGRVLDAWAAVVTVGFAGVLCGAAALRPR